MADDGNARAAALPENLTGADWAPVKLAEHVFRLEAKAWLYATDFATPVRKRFATQIFFGDGADFTRPYRRRRFPGRKSIGLIIAVTIKHDDPTSLYRGGCRSTLLG
tara:strand:+ start:1092 stop:1412 length:321 start_codon:yes stop_codon:yes gene_type:complete